MRSNAQPVPPEKLKAIEDALVAAMVEGRPVNVNAMTREFGVTAFVIRSTLDKVEADYGAKALRRRPGRPRQAHVETVAGVPIDRFLEIASFYEAGRSLADLADEYAVNAATLQEALATLGAESPGEKVARLEQEAKFRLAESEARSAEDRRLEEEAQAQAMSEEGEETEPGQLVTPAPEPIRVPSHTPGTPYFRGNVWTVELAPLGRRFPVADYVRGLEAEKKIIEADEFRRLVIDYANNGALPNMKYKALTSALAGFWEMTFGRQRQQRVIVRPVTTINDKTGEESRILVLLTGFTKKTDATPQTQVDRALNAWNEYLEGLRTGGRSLKRGKKNPDDAPDELTPSDESRLRMAEGKLVEEFQLSIQDFMFRNKVSRQDLATKLGIRRAELNDLLDYPGVAIGELVRVAFVLGLQLHGRIGPLSY